MTLQSIGGPSSLFIPSHPVFYLNATVTSTPLLIDAAAEAAIQVGRVFLPARTGSKTISAAGGGSISWMTTTVTFASGSTNFRVGIQDVSTTAGPAVRGDGTYDVQGDLTGGGGGITANAVNTTAMTSGTKTIAHGDYVAIYWEMTARGGTDLVNVQSASQTGTSTPFGMTLVTLSGGVYTWTVGVGIVWITFDDGTFGFMDGGWVMSSALPFPTVSPTSATTPDEYANVFQLPFPSTVEGLWFIGQTANASANFEMILYSDPLGTPVAEATVLVDANQTGGSVTNRASHALLATPVDIEANTWYAVACRPTTANVVVLSYFDVANVNHWDGMSMGQNMYAADRSNQTGAFSPTTTRRFCGGVRLSGFDDGAGGAAEPQLMGQAVL